MFNEEYILVTGRKIYITLDTHTHTHTHTLAYTDTHAHKHTLTQGHGSRWLACGGLTGTQA